MRILRDTPSINTEIKENPDPAIAALLTRHLQFGAEFNANDPADLLTVFVIEPGDTLLVPANWWHHVRGLEKSITMSHNFFNDSNLTQYMVHMLRNFPVLAKVIDKSPNWREELGIKWTLSDFSAIDA